MSAHTPGPWKIDSTVGGSLGDKVTASDGLTVCRTSLERSPEHREANARLIAAAPDFLEAAKSVVLAWENDEIGQLDEMEIDKLRAAIELATKGASK